MANTPLKGLDDVVRSLGQIRDSSTKKAAKAGINAGIGVLAKECRQAINSSPASTEMKRAARLTIGKRLKKLGDEFVGKAGFSVGKPSKAKKEKAVARAKDKSQGGVGISAANIHWPILGTKERVTKTGHPTGAMPATLAGVIERAVASASSAMLNVARTKVRQVIESEAARARK